MKGYSEVSVEVAAKALENFKTWHQQAEELFDELVERYHVKYYTKGTTLARWRYRKKTPLQFLLKDTGFYKPYSSRLYTVCSTYEEYETMYKWENSYKEREVCKAIRALLSASSSNKLLLDQEICAFLEEWKKE